MVDVGRYSSWNGPKTGLGENYSRTCMVLSDLDRTSLIGTINDFSLELDTAWGPADGG
tara:strand:- start:1720 stop:1893 length:174 start_codon:yes stop_codon:yes gene_type:complete